MNRSRLSALALLAAALFAAALPVAGEVYLLGPGRGKGVRGFRLSELAGARRLMREPVRYNGVETEMEIYLVSRTLDQLLAELRAMLGNPPEEATPGGVAISLPPEKGWRTMLLLFGNERLGNVTVFTMKLPEKMPTRFDWPDELPLPPNAEPVTVIYFAGSGSYYGSFRNAGDRRDAMLSLTSALYGAGYHPQTGESAHPDESRGELFVASNPRRILLLTLNDDGEGSMLLRPATLPKK